MIRTATVIATALAAASALAGIPAHANPAAIASSKSVKLGPGPEHARLTALSGTYDVQLTFWFRPGANGITTTGTSTIRPLLGGLFIEEQIDGVLNGTPFTTLSWTGFNTGSREYEATRIASTNTSRITESGVWNDQSGQFELKGSYKLGADTWAQRTVIQPSSADTMVASSYLSFGTVPEWKAVEIRYKKRAK
ncbi:MAG TPA: DUF1579 family protein [Gemmatimonadaceae bacterium]|nr:DUF1579 family protein [Gemmatimonadaceae bacterium]